ncbi:unnamed protein product [Pleuronectes platessa]|uniref:Uncharacterized protein n=1 Tax=Pleuronectes platessa TaxID=8262 RepID=A0A9N7TVI1_PLEPL|nr:unnamed protein product [Pleuronectes platessa]
MISTESPDTEQPVRPKEAENVSSEQILWRECSDRSCGSVGGGQQEGHLTANRAVTPPGAQVAAVAIKQPRLLRSNVWLVLSAAVGLRGNSPVGDPARRSVSGNTHRSHGVPHVLLCVFMLDEVGNFSLLHRLTSDSCAYSKR